MSIILIKHYICYSIVYVWYSILLLTLIFDWLIDCSIRYLDLILLFRFWFDAFRFVHVSTRIFRTFRVWFLFDDTRNRIRIFDLLYETFSFDFRLINFENVLTLLFNRWITRIEFIIVKLEIVIKKEFRK